MDHDFTKDYQDAVQTVRKRRRKKSTSIGRKFKGAAKSRGAEDQKRREVRLQEANKLLSRDIPNPFLHMNIEELKQHAISLCYRQIKEQMGKGMSYTESRGGAVRDVATIVCVDRSTIFKWLHELDTVGELSRSKRGRHSKAITPIVNPQFRQKFCDFVRANAHQQGEPNLTTQALAEWVNEILSQELKILLDTLLDSQFENTPRHPCDSHFPKGISALSWSFLLENWNKTNVYEMITHYTSCQQCRTVSNSVNSVNSFYSYSAVLPPSSMVFFYITFAVFPNI